MFVDNRRRPKWKKKATKINVQCKLFYGEKLDSSSMFSPRWRFLFRLSLSLTSASLISTNFLKSLKLVVRLGIRPGKGLDLEKSVCSWTTSPSSEPYFLYWRHALIKNRIRARKHAMPQIRKRPQKLLRDNWLELSLLIFAVQSLCSSHLSWIFCRSPFSESWRMEVDKSTARGESLWNACYKRKSQ